jgi:hypothetical protein
MRRTKRKPATVGEILFSSAVLSIRASSVAHITAPADPRTYDGQPRFWATLMEGGER